MQNPHIRLCAHADTGYDSGSPLGFGETMTDTQRAEIHRLLERQRQTSLASAKAARKALMQTGLYNKDGTLKSEWGGEGKKKRA